MNSIKTLKESNILYIVHNYTAFQKDPIEEAAKYFKKVYVLVRYKPLSRIAQYIPIKWLKKYQDSLIIDTKNIPNNVEVIRTPVWYLPFGSFYKMLGESHFRAVERVIKKRNIRFDLIHSHFIWSSGYVGMKLKEKYHVPLLVTGHGYDVYQLPFKDEWWGSRTTLTLNSANVVITVSETNKTHLMKLGIDPSKIQVLINGYDSKKFYSIEKNRSRKLLGIESDKEIFLTIGNLEIVKGHEYLIKAINFIVNEFPDIHLYVIGSGRLYANTKELIKSLGLEKNISLLGFIRHEELNEWINACDVFVLPSLDEGSPTVMFEALGCGKPIVSTKVGGVPEIINSSDYGLLVEKGNVEELASALKRSLGKSWDYTGIQRFGKQFAIKNTVNKSIRLYKELL